MNKRFNEAVKRVSAIDWNTVGYAFQRESNVALAKEFLRRAALIIKEYNLDVKFPFFSAAKAIGKSQQIDIEKVCSQINTLNNTFLRRACECYIEWASLTDEGEPAAMKFPDLYEPLIKLFERGGSIGIHHGEVIVGKFAFPLKNSSIIALEDPIDISDMNLEKWDS